ncbi:bacteriohemerythrin [Anaeromyxobacter paludicola]|uniref:Hemerythrin-like domain-containing protein n=1 Tax=Anaeromyxobacter paludicola TaxID=2918171 RepID=A0ABM7XE99_9BACT|nr:hemerythrin family protein [Anaeromyxobacter paludicola]BDG10216.1 hypothetical protein AMPC_33290 [Anaeromyxobacter paludicola]
MAGGRPREPSSTIDAQHRALFDQLHRVMDARQRGPADAALELAEFQRQVRAHFADEERMLAWRGYPDLPEHRAEHAAFLAELETMDGDLSAASAAFLRGWLVNHTTGSDRRYLEWTARAHPERPRPARSRQAIRTET